MEYRVGYNDLLAIIHEEQLMPGHVNEGEFLTREVVNIHRDGFGKIEGKGRYLKGISLIDMNLEFETNVMVSQEMSEFNYFSIYLNFGAALDCSINKKNYHIKRNSHNMWSFPNTQEGTSCYASNKQYRNMSVMFSNEYLSNIVNKYPDLLTDIFIRSKKPEQLRVFKSDIIIDNEIVRIINQINNAHLIGSTAPLYTESKILELLALQLHDHKCGLSNATCNSYCKSHRDIEKIHEAKHLLLSDICNPPTTYELSRNVGVDEKKLKYGFKEVFNQTIYGCLMEYKMDKARKLLLNTDKQITAIAYECGYEYPSHFTTAFKRNFGTSPADYRKNVGVRTA